jgi:hypothetical protein
MTPLLLKTTGILCISSFTISQCGISEGLQVSLQASSLLFGLAHCYLGTNPVAKVFQLKKKIKFLEETRKRLTEENQQLSTIEDAIAYSKKLDNLIETKNKQLSQVEIKFRESWEEREQQLIDREANLHQEIKQREETINQEILKRTQELEELQAQINEQAQQLEQELNQDKQEFLKNQEAELKLLEDENEFLKSQLVEAEAEIRRHDFPRLPEGVNLEDIIARRVIEILRDCKVIADFRGAWIESGFVILRVRPRRGGQREVEKWANRIQLELKLDQLPEILTTQGAVQLRIKPQNIGLDNTPCVGEPQIQNSEFDRPLHEFIEPTITIDPYGPIRKIEKDWVLWLWTCHNPPIRNKRAVIKRVWGASNGARPQKFLAARERLHQILEEAKIPYRRRDK